MNIKYLVNSELDANDIITVFKNVGWNKNIDDIVDAFRNSYYIMAYDNDKLVGFARAISDGIYYTSIFDVVVLNEYQKQGIGKHLVVQLVEKFKGTYIFLTYTEGNKQFYESCGFKENNHSMWIPR